MIILHVLLSANWWSSFFAMATPAFALGGHFALIVHTIGRIKHGRLEIWNSAYCVQVYYLTREITVEHTKINFFISALPDGPKQTETL